MSAQKELAVKVEDLTKMFQIPLEAHSGLKQKLINTLKGRKGYREFTPLNGISFEIEKGDFFGIVGRNGSGKSTLLKTLAGIYSPDKGAVHVNGTLVPFIELGVGFNPELTGRENVFLNGALLGFSRKQMEDMYDDIVDFAELHDFMEERLKNYSSGMQVRLAFSIAIRADGDILLLDEVLAVGDEAFQQKCFEYFGSLKKANRTVILVTHDMSAIERFCNKAMLIEKGQVRRVGTNLEISQLYREIFIEDASRHVDKQNKKLQTESEENGIQSDILKNIKVEILQNEVQSNVVRARKEISIRLSFDSAENIAKAACGLNIINSQNHIVIATGLGGVKEGKWQVKKGLNEVTFSIASNILRDDNYRIDAAIARHLSGYSQELIYQRSSVAGFSSRGVSLRKHALVHPEVHVVVS